MLPEIVSIGVYDSQVAVRNKVITKNRKTTMFEIELPIEEGGISYINSEKMPINPNVIICAKPGQMRHTKLPFKCYYIHIILKDGILYDTLMDTPNFVKTNKSSKYLELYKKLRKYFDSGLEDDKIIIHSLILELIYTLSKDSQKLFFRESIKSSNYKVIETTINYIKTNLTSDLSLETVSEFAGFSPIHFHNCFKASTGKTLHEYVEEQRIKKAANMLITTNNTLTQIAYECGFSSQSYFSYAFKRKMQLTPREYAREVFERYETEK